MTPTKSILQNRRFNWNATGTFALAMGLSIMSTGCSRAPDKAPSSPEMVGVESRLDMLETRIKYLEKRDIALAARLPDAVDLRPSQKGWQPLVASSLALAVSIKDVQSYADGSRVTLEIGNLSSATISKLSFSGEWGEVDNDDNTLAPIRSDRITIPSEIAPGAWTPKTVDLAKLKPGQFGFLRISQASAETISLARK